MKWIKKYWSKEKTRQYMREYMRKYRETYAYINKYNKGKQKRDPNRVKFLDLSIEEKRLYRQNLYYINRIKKAQWIITS